MRIPAIVTLLCSLILICPASAQVYIEDDTDWDFVEPDYPSDEELDSIISDTVPIIPTIPLSNNVFLPSVFTGYELLDTLSAVPKRPNSDNPALEWINRQTEMDNLTANLMQTYMVRHPELVRYNINDLPEPPKFYHAEIDPTTAKLVITEIEVTPDASSADAAAPEVRKHWIHNFDLALQFSQAYISPNWYQGGNSSLNMIADALWTVKLNQAIHPKLKFETSVRAKVSIMSAPDDTLRSYNVTENLLQINSLFGYKAAKRWYYSLNLLFKTPIIHSYTSNTTTMTAAIFSPGELNAGLGMTYNYANKKDTFKFDASISPLSYNLKTVTNSRIDETIHGLEAGRRSLSSFGSSAEFNLTWKITYNIIYASKLFVFTDYDYMQGDWQNSLTFNINRFLSTRLYFDMRYDSTTPRFEESKWHKWQVKEVLSIGFNYKI